MAVRVAVSTVGPMGKLLAAGLCVWSPGATFTCCPGGFNNGLLLSGSFRLRDSIAFPNGLISTGFAGCTFATIGLIVRTLAWAPIPALKCGPLNTAADRPRPCPSIRDAATENKSIENILPARTLLTPSGILIFYLADCSVQTF